MARILYKPLGLLVSTMGAILAGAIFKQIWRAVAHEEKAPKATDESKGWGEVVAASAAEGAVLGGVKALVARAGATGFARLTGEWPGPGEK